MNESPAVRRLLFTFIACSLVLANFAVDVRANEHELNLTTEKVIVFKDGYCLVVKRGTAVADAQGEVFTAEVPDAAVLGSFWATPKEGRLVNMIAGWKETTTTTEKNMACSGTLEILQANLGK